MMKTFITHVPFLCALMLFSGDTSSQITESFNARPGVESNHVKPYLQQHCWQLTGFENSSSQRSLEGDGSLLSDPVHQASRLYTPVLDIKENLSLSFKYSVTGNIAGHGKIVIALTDPNNEVVAILDSVDASSMISDSAYLYNKNFVTPAGAYKLSVMYERESLSSFMILDELKISANAFYPSGCNAAPVAKNDVVMGSMNRTATGVLVQNDFDANGEPIVTYMINACNDGKVELTEDGHFTFTPNPGFSGNSTSFTYQVCDKGYNPLCSEIATVTLNFPSLSIFPLTVKEIQANYIDKSVVLKWTATPEKNTDRFEIERSTDGTTFEKAGQVKAAGLTSMKQNYFFNDNVSENLVKKNDLYYRLKQIATDGRWSYSKVLIVRVFKTRTIETMSVVPNAAVNDISVNMQLNKDAFVVIKLKGQSGDELLRRSGRALTGDRSITLEGTGSILKGVYFLEVMVNSNERMVIQVIKT